MRILVLSDGRVSNTKQSFALAYGILNYKKNFTVEILDIKFNALSSLPNHIILPNIVAKIPEPKNKEYDVIISCGRKLAKVNVYIKSRYGSKNCKNITILKPNMSFRKFSAVILPYHDNLLSTPANNIINTYGALSYMDDKLLSSEMNKWKTIADKFTTPYIAVMIGGSSKHFNMSHDFLVKAMQNLNRVALNMNATLLITTSRRTPEYINTIINENLNCSYYYFNFNKSKNENNPYTAFLGFANYCVCTADSISMMSEILQTGKPLYLLSSENMSKKYEIFTNVLTKNNCIRYISDILDNLETFHYKNINNIQDVVKDLIGKINI